MANTNRSMTFHVASTKPHSGTSAVSLTTESAVDGKPTLLYFTIPAIVALHLGIYRGTTVTITAEEN